MAEQAGRPAFRVLTIDGGGMRGVYAAAFLAGLERDLGPISKNFNLICGTSTGGLIALALGAGRRGAEVVDFYREKGPRIFAHGGPHKRLPTILRAMARKHKYSNHELRAALDEILGTKKLCDSTVHLCIPTVDFVTCQPWVFKTDHGEGLSRDGEVLMRDVALATSAAPMFFPIATAKIPAHGTHHRFIDGGLWANSPVLVGLTEAVRFFVGDGKPFGSLHILSVGLPAGAIGNANVDRYDPLIYKPPAKLFPFVFQLLDLSMTSQISSALYSARFIGESLSVPFHLERIEPTALAPKQAKHITLDGAAPIAIETLIQLGAQEAERQKLRTAVKSFFSRHPSI